jgi:hypothetical protein
VPSSARWLYVRSRELQARLLRFLPKFPLFRGAYCYYWFYMFFIWYKPNRLEMMVLNSHAMRSALQRGIPQDPTAYRMNSLPELTFGIAQTLKSAVTSESEMVFEVRENGKGRW